MSFEVGGNTYALMRITLDDGEGTRILGILHDEPVLHIKSAPFPSLSPLLQFTQEAHSLTNPDIPCR